MQVVNGITCRAPQLKLDYAGDASQTITFYEQ